MPKIETVTVKITTGAQGTSDPVRIRFNGFELPLKTTSGGTGPGERYEGAFRLASMGHSCTLVGPKSGTWQLDSLEVVFDHGMGLEPVTHAFGAKVLEANQELNILDKPPPPAFEV